MLSFQNRHHGDRQLDCVSEDQGGWSRSLSSLHDSDVDTLSAEYSFDHGQPDVRSHINHRLSDDDEYPARGPGRYANIYHRRRGGQYSSVRY